MAAGFLPPPPEALDDPDHWYWDALAFERAKNEVRSRMLVGWISVWVAVLGAATLIVAIGIALSWWWL